jgi:hypothetical protein
MLETRTFYVNATVGFWRGRHGIGAQLPFLQLAPVIRPSDVWSPIHPHRAHHNLKIGSWREAMVELTESVNESAAACSTQTARSPLPPKR